MRPWLTGLLATLAVANLAAEPPADLAAAVALERTLQTAIARAEPAIACVIVSRRAEYLRFGGLPTPENPGRLGEFRVNRPARAVLDERERQILRELDLSDPTNVPDFFGSGVVIDPSGLILTNYHVVRDATRIFIRLPDRKGSYADIHAADARADLAVLRMLTPPGPLPSLSLSDADRVRKGQFVIALTNPYAAGYDDGSPSASWGIISNIRRRAPSTASEYERVKPLHHYGTLLQTDARLNLGCSGGALVNLRGELVGLTTSLAAINGTETAGGYAVPMNDGLRRIVDVLRRGREVEYGFLGIGFDPNPQGREGIPLTQVLVNGPAARAGLRVRDVILAVNGVPVRDIDDLYLTIGTLLAGSPATLLIESNGRGRRTVTAVLSKFHHGMFKIVSHKPEMVRGLRVDYPDVAGENGGNEMPEAVLVTEVIKGSPADRAGIKDRDLIATVNGRSVSTPAEFLQAANVDGPLRLRLSGATDREVVIP